MSDIKEQVAALCRDVDVAEKLVEVTAFAGRMLAERDALRARVAELEARAADADARLLAVLRELGFASAHVGRNDGLELAAKTCEAVALGLRQAKKPEGT